MRAGLFGSTQTGRRRDPPDSLGEHEGGGRLVAFLAAGREAHHDGRLGAAAKSARHESRKPGVPDGDVRRPSPQGVDDVAEAG
eukprot:CAMPEP_0176328904 /NCGR_PEP_ID=MMETSP0121_2-20121125/75201_1 /TAXON_ID=160619 /ORGANISM="Kryptoperidinium foliaceum, Strain CCMP 1326" /LENGTH=82 /DNA_ID=CAMNT_0017671585 /DNA_START=40 /DNA_END=285 /DNA_ORIENTATION=-